MTDVLLSPLQQCYYLQNNSLGFLNSNMFYKCLNFLFPKSNFSWVFGKWTSRAMAPVALQELPLPTASLGGFTSKRSQTCDQKMFGTLGVLFHTCACRQASGARTGRAAFAGRTFRVAGRGVPSLSARASRRGHCCELRHPLLCLAHEPVAHTARSMLVFPAVVSFLLRSGSTGKKRDSGFWSQGA